MEEFFFDLNGYSILPDVLSAADCAELNSWIDAREAEVQRLSSGEWLRDGAQLQSYYEKDGAASIDDGTNLQHVFECGEVFERQLANPAWIGRVNHYIGPGLTPFVHEMFVNLRGPGGYIGCHSGGPRFDEEGEVLRSRWGAAVHKGGVCSHDLHAGQGSHRGHHVKWGVPCELRFHGAD